MSFDIALFESEVRKQYGDESLKTLDGKVKFGDPGTFIPFSSEALNIAIGIGGVPRGRVIEIFGPESGGKTTLALDLCASAQKLDPKAFVLFMDSENALNPEYAKKLGVDTSKNRFRISQTNELEETCNLIMKAARFGAAMVVVDSVPTLEYAKQLDADEQTASRAGGIAKPLRDFLKRLVKVCAETKTTVVFINHITFKVGVVYGNPETTPGGGGLKFYASVRLDVRPVSGGMIPDKKTGEVIGKKTKVKVAKNKVGTPLKEAEFNLVYGLGIDTYADLVIVGVKTGVLTKSGAWINFGELKWQGDEKTCDAFKDDPKLCAKVREAVHKALRA